MHAFRYLEMLKNEVHDTLNGDMFTYLCMVTRYTDVNFHSISDNTVVVLVKSCYKQLPRDNTDVSSTICEY